MPGPAPVQLGAARSATDTTRFVFTRVTLCYRGICCHLVSVRLSVRPSQVGVVPTPLYLRTLRRYTNALLLLLLFYLRYKGSRGIWRKNVIIIIIYYYYYYYIKTAKRRITQTTPHDSPWNLFYETKFSWNYPQQGRQMQVG